MSAMQINLKHENLLDERERDEKEETGSNYAARSLKDGN